MLQPSGPGYSWLLAAAVELVEEASQGVLHRLGRCRDASGVARLRFACAGFRCRFWAVDRCRFAMWLPCRIRRPRVFISEGVCFCILSGHRSQAPVPELMRLVDYCLLVVFAVGEPFVFVYPSRRCQRHPKPKQGKDDLHSAASLRSRLLFEAPTRAPEAAVFTTRVTARQGPRRQLQCLSGMFVSCSCFWSSPQGSPSALPCETCSQ